jgi:hypothetical protein
VVRVVRWRRTAPFPRPTRLTTLLLTIVGTVTAVAGVIGLLAMALSERVTPDPVSGRFAFLAGAAAITAAVAGCFLIWVRLAAGDPAAASADIEEAP